MKKAILITVIITIVALLAFVAALAGFFSFFPLKYKKEITTWSNYYNLDPALVASVINCESKYRPGVISSAGARGLMQLMPMTASWLAEDDPELSEFDESMLDDPNINIKLGCKYLNMLFSEFPDINTTLAAYNAGPNRVKTWLTDPAYSQDGKIITTPYAETTSYIQKINKYLRVYSVLY